MAGIRSAEITCFGNRDENTCLHLACSSPLCSRELIVFIKGLLDDPECINDVNTTGETPLDLLHKNKNIDAAAKDKCQRMLKPGAIASELSRKVDELARLRLDLLRKPKQEETGSIEIKRRVRPIEYNMSITQSDLTTHTAQVIAAPRATSCIAIGTALSNGIETVLRAEVTETNVSVVFTHKKIDGVKTDTAHVQLLGEKPHAIDIVLNAIEFNHASVDNVLAETQVAVIKSLMEHSCHVVDSHDKILAATQLAVVESKVGKPFQVLGSYDLSDKSNCVSTTASTDVYHYEKSEVERVACQFITDFKPIHSRLLPVFCSNSVRVIDAVGTLPVRSLGSCWKNPVQTGITNHQSNFSQCMNTVYHLARVFLKSNDCPTFRLIDVNTILSLWFFIFQHSIKPIIMNFQVSLLIKVPPIQRLRLICRQDYDLLDTHH